MDSIRGEGRSRIITRTPSQTLYLSTSTVDDEARKDYNGIGVSKKKILGKKKV